ncbi:hypothetical protein G6011_03394 [Alternaria panax]|uniref:Uncharacterized protein n=1 Tax=Alternaria panax TaxID=48097 RepID=A0AAD4NT43_9PLEO|nr:hypothetical protein G6011_03394 [Alternaria panax]
MLNYITAELRMRDIEDLALAEANRKNASEESKENNKSVEEKNKDTEDFKPGSWIKKKDGG